MGSSVGVVKAILRYPVKSLAGEELDEAFITFEGVEMDRIYSLLDLETGLVVSGKNPKLYSKLLDVKASILNGVLVVKLPGGKEYYREECDKALSAYLMRKVKLVENEGHSLRYSGIEVEFGEDVRYFEKQSSTREKTFHDSMPIHIIFEEDLKKLGLCDEFVRFRPNIVIQLSVERQNLSNSLLMAGDALLKIVKPTRRCIMVTLPQQKLPHDINILKRIRENCSGFVGYYAEVIREGSIRKGDRLKFYAADAP